MTRIKAGLAILAQCSIDEKLTLCFQAFDKDKSSYLDLDEIFNLVCCIEKSLDGRSDYFREQSSKFFDAIDHNSDGKISLNEFVRACKTNPICTPILDFINAVESNEYIQVPEMKLAQIHLDGTYSDLHSPMNSVSDVSAISDLSINDEDYIMNPVNEETELNQFPNFEVNDNFESLENLEEIEEVKNDLTGKSFKTEIVDYTFDEFSNEEIEDQYSTVVKNEIIEVPKIEAAFKTQKMNKSRERILIEIPEPLMTPKESRSGCTRLCTKNTCRLF